MQGNKSDAVVTTLNALVRLLSFSFGRQEELVPLKEEIESIESYVRIQQTRYGGSFRFRLIRRAPLNGEGREGENWRIPKLTLQPLVENALFHGVLPSAREAEIRVVLSRSAGELVIVVRDTGVGIPRGRLELLRRGESHPEAFAKDRLNPIGLHNIDERLRMIFGENYGIKLYSRYGRGTAVLVRLPRRPVG
jgi:two-component system sensor histidine kinase YesM